MTAEGLNSAKIEHVKDGSGLAAEAAGREDREQPGPPQEVGLPPAPTSPSIRRALGATRQARRTERGARSARCRDWWPGAVAAPVAGSGGGAGRDGPGRAGPRLGARRGGAAAASLTVVRHHRLALVQLLRGSQMVLDALELRRQRGKRRGRHRAGGDAQRQQRAADNGSPSRRWRRPLPLPVRDTGAPARWAGCRPWRCAREERPLLMGGGGRRGGLTGPRATAAGRGRADWPVRPSVRPFVCPPARASVRGDEQPHAPPAWLVSVCNVSHSRRAEGPGDLGAAGVCPGPARGNGGLVPALRGRAAKPSPALLAPFLWHVSPNNHADLRPGG